jgi:hypothetical protein
MKLRGDGSFACSLFIAPQSLLIGTNPANFLHRPATRLSSCPADLEGMRLPGTRIQAALRDF